MAHLIGGTDLYRVSAALTEPPNPTTPGDSPVEHREMLTDRLSSHVKAVAQLPQRQAGTLMKHVEQESSTWVGERFEDDVCIHPSIMQVNACLLQ
ncbi:hypothetical protein SAMN04488550_1755 [Gordonia malaquae]|nr:hypothetical protein SAMN04488550_1755 [Gordonia malaquae]